MKVFLCHQNESKPFVRNLAFRLAQAGIESWVDDAEIGPGESLVQRISEGIHRETNALIACVSRKALDSRWVQSELDQGKYVEITQAGFQLIVILLDDVDHAELPEYLHSKKHVLWEKERPDGKDEIVDHPAYARIVRQLFKGAAISSDTAALDAQRLLESFLMYLYSCGSQREITKRFREGMPGEIVPMIYGEARNSFSLVAIPLWTAYEQVLDDPLAQNMRNLISATMHADIAVKDWGSGYEAVEFQQSVIADFEQVLVEVSAFLGIEETQKKITDRLELQRRPDMGVIYQLDTFERKSSFGWGADIFAQYYRFGIHTVAEDLPSYLEAEAKRIIRRVGVDPYRAWADASWLYPSHN